MNGQKVDCPNPNCNKKYKSKTDANKCCKKFKSTPKPYNRNKFKQL